MQILLQLLLLIGITLLPALELRASIPYGILGNESWGIAPGLMSWPLVVAICTVTNILLGWAVYWLLIPVMQWLERFAWFSKIIKPLLERTQRKISPYVEKYGELGIALFIGIPLPGSGVYTGAVGAFLLGVSRRKFAIANVIGVCIAAAGVTAITLAIDANVEFIRRWFDWLIHV